MTLEETFALALENHQKHNLQVAEKLYNEVLKLNPNHSLSYNNLGLIINASGDHLKAKKFYEKATEINPNYADAFNSLGVVLQQLEDYSNALKSYEKVIEIKPNHLGANNNLGSLYYLLGDTLKAISYYEKAIEIDSNNLFTLNNIAMAFHTLEEDKKSISYYKKALKIDPHQEEIRYNLAELLYSKSQYENAVAEFKLINFKNSKSFLLSCFYKLGYRSVFFKELDNLINEGEVNALIGSLSTCAEIKYGITRPNLFCKEPLKYVLETNLAEKYDFKNTFVKTIKNILNKELISKKTQRLLTNGIQTNGNIFQQKKDQTKIIKDIIYSEIEKYKINFKNSKEGLIKNWPANYDIYGWLISMKSGGKITPHIHEYGWLSGSIYINIPPKLKTNSGNLVVCIEENESSSSNKNKIINLSTGSLCLFPASLYHYTIPFESEEERLVLAFDVIAKT